MTSPSTCWCLPSWFTTAPFPALDRDTHDTAERRELLGRFIDLLGRERVRFVTADREFISFEWIGWLLEQKLPFRIRIKAGEYLLHDNGPEKRACEWFAQRSCRCKPQRMDLWGLRVFVGGRPLVSKDSKGNPQHLIVISNEPGNLLESCRLSQEKRLAVHKWVN